MEDESPGTPWYRSSAADPFKLARIIRSNDTESPPFYFTSSFPFDYESLDTLWDGIMSTPDNQVLWKKMVDRWKGTILVGSLRRLLIFQNWGSVRPIIVNVDCPEVQSQPKYEWKVTCAAWAMNISSEQGFAIPLIIFAAYSIIFVFNPITKEIVGRLCGHGGEITSIAIHPRDPGIFCTTSKDMTTRVYDLKWEARQKPSNPHWPPLTKPSLAGPAFGLQSTEPEGTGMGRCVGVLVGGRSGGHEAGVLHAEFHPTYPLIATCGMDRAVKIWRLLPVFSEDGFVREDKPLFSTNYLHKARVLSVSWLGQDILISHGAPAMMRRSDDPERRDDLYEEEGKAMIWRWLGFDRFFPPGKLEQQRLRGCASDYRNSESFKILSSYALPLITRGLHVYKCAKRQHDPMVLVPMGKTIRIFNITNFNPREPPPFPLETEEELVSRTKRIKVGGAAPGEDDDNNSVEEEMFPAPTDVGVRSLFDSVPGWELKAVVNGDLGSQLSDIDNCEMAFAGGVVLGVGKRGTMYMWNL